MNKSENFNIFLLHCVYSDIQEYRSLKALVDLLNKTQWTIKIICIYNQEIDLSNFNNVDITFISGTNVLNEFSAWDEGYQFIKNDIDEKSVVILTNDTILSNHPFYGCLDRALLKCLRTSFNNLNPSIIGIKQILDFKYVKDYLSSFLVVLIGQETIKTILEGILKIESNSSINKDYGSESLINCDDKDYKRFINNWLTKPGKNSWHKAEQITKENKSKLQMKAHCILLEHSIAIRAKKNNIEVHDIFEFTGLKILRYIYSFRKDYFF